MISLVGFQHFPSSTPNTLHNRSKARKHTINPFYALEKKEAVDDCVEETSEEKKNGKKPSCVCAQSEKSSEPIVELFSNILLSFIHTTDGKVCSRPTQSTLLLAYTFNLMFRISYDIHYV